MNIHSRYKVMMFIILPSITFTGFLVGVFTSRLIFGELFDGPGILIVFTSIIIPIHIMGIFIIKKIYRQKLNDNITGG